MRRCGSGGITVVAVYKGSEVREGPCVSELAVSDSM